MLLTRWTRPFLVLTFLFALTTTGFAWPPGGNGGGNGGGKGGGNGGGEDPPPEPAPTAYGLLRFSMPSDYQGGTAAITEMNEFGEAVGYYPVGSGYEQPFYIDINSSGSVVTNLNDIFPDLTVLNVDPPTADVTGWQISAATGINNFGDVALALSRISDPDGLDELRGAVLELRPDPLDATVEPRLHVIPDGAWAHTYARRINDNGIVLGRGDSTTSYVYRPALHSTTADPSVEILPFAKDGWYIQMNNDDQLIFSDGGVWQYILGDTNPVFLTNEVTLRPYGLSDTGAFCGSRNSRKKKTTGAVYDGTVIDIPELSVADALNVSGDVLGLSSSSELTLVHPTHGALNLEQLTIGIDSQDQQLWENGAKLFYQITERNVSGTDPSVAEFPVVCGSLRRYDTEFLFHYDAFVLVPIPPE